MRSASSFYQVFNRGFYRLAELVKLVTFHELLTPHKSDGFIRFVNVDIGDESPSWSYQTCCALVLISLSFMYEYHN